MASINIIARQRKAALRALQGALRNVRSQAEAVNRYLSRLRSRKNLIPEQAELNKIMEGMRALDQYATNAVSAVQEVSNVFSV